MCKNIQSKKASLAEDWHPADIVAAVRKAGTSLRKLSVSKGYSPWTIRCALVHKYPGAERIIADCIGVEPWEIWPSRYGADNKPLPAKKSGPKPRKSVSGAPKKARKKKKYSRRKCASNVCEASGE